MPVALTSVKVTSCTPLNPSDFRGNSYVARCGIMHNRGTFIGHNRTIADVGTQPSYVHIFHR